jgi:DNA recombination protein RmuC
VQQYFSFGLLIIGLVMGLAAGALTAWFAFRNRPVGSSGATVQSEVKIGQLTERAARVPLLETELADKSTSLLNETSRAAALAMQVARVPELEAALEHSTDRCQGLERQVAELKARLTGVESTFAATLKAEQDKLAFTEQAKQQMSDAFQTLANNILEQKTARFADQNKANIEQILGPLRTKITEFQEQVQKISAEDGNGRTVLGEQVKQLASLNRQLSDDARNLTTALKGSSKTQGNWGEMILERVLEASGLHRGREYELRETYTREDGRRGQPDVVINLPEGRHLVIDAKVSLTDYELCVNTADDSEREGAAARHVQSVRRHMRDLSEKNYTELLGLKTLDFVVMFVPIEPAFAAAISADGDLWETALKKNVLLVSPSALLFVLRTVAILWRQEEQARNVKNIAKRGGELYNKLVGFVEEFDKVGKSLRQAQDSFDDAHRKLSTGQGNVIRQAEMLRKLGVRPSKSLPQGIIEEAMQESLLLPELAESEGVEAPGDPGSSENTEMLPEEEAPF